MNSRKEWNEDIKTAKQLGYPTKVIELLKKEYNPIARQRILYDARNGVYGDNGMIFIDKPRKKSKRIRKIMCIETGHIYESQAEASEETGIHQASINHNLKGRCGVAGGFHFKYVDQN